MQGAPFSIDPIGIVSALREEQANTPDYLPFKVIARKNEKGIWRLEVTGIGRSVKLDESYEGCKVGWSQPIKGAAQILSVIPEDGIIHVHHGSSSPPPADGVIYLYPPSYLDPLLQYWSDANRHSTTARWLKHYNPDTSSLKPLLPPEKFPLRRKQSSAFDLLKKPLGFLWGPPGTGKTYTLGAMLAQYLIKRPHKRVLLLSATNMALDQALVSVDNALEHLSETAPQANAARKTCKRLGHQFVARFYSDREHLIPTYDSELVKVLSALEAEEPEKSDVQRYQRWQKQVEEIREIIKVEAKAALRRTRLAAMTATRAIYTWNDLAELGYDLVVFDESSQISRALSLALLPLGGQALFAGDDKQLAPIARSNSENAKRWLSSSLFQDRKTGLQCTLTEQSRMSADICHVISRVFYHDMPKGDQLEVAAEQAADSEWKRVRKPLQLSSIPDKALAVIDVKEKDDGTYSSKMGGHIRYWSAEQCASIAREFQDQGRSEDIHILTPFRAQRSLIRRKLKEAGVRGIKVSTVHRAQGSECHTVLFDPVNGDDNFLHGRDEYEKKSAKRLINVALSRAQAQLIIPLSERDRKNPLFDQIYRLAMHRPKNTESFQSLRDFSGKAGFPSVLIGKKIRFHDCTGQVLRLEPYNKCKTWVVINDLEAGKERQFDLEQLLVGIGAVSKTSKTEEPIACPVCSEEANSIEQLSQHVKKHHPELLKELFDCPFCTAKVSLQKYAKHNRLVHQDSDKRKPPAPAPAPAPAPKGGSPCPFCFENVADGNLGLHLAKQCPVKNPKRGRKGSSQLCPICQRYIPSQTYKVHIQGHQKAAAQSSSKPSQPPKRNKVSVSNPNTVGKRGKHSLEVPSTNPEIEAYLERTKQR